MIMEKAMEALTGNRSNRKRFRVLSGGKPAGKRRQTVSEAESGIICQYGVVVQCTTVAGMELVEFEFLPDAA
jgi:hypothetical protein